MSRQEPPNFTIHRDEARTNGDHSNGAEARAHHANANGAADGSHRKNGHGAGHSWDEPDWSILDDRRGNLPEFPVDALPAQCQGWVERAAHGAAATPAHI